MFLRQCSIMAPDNRMELMSMAAIIKSGATSSRSIILKLHPAGSVARSVLVSVSTESSYQMLPKHIDCLRKLLGTLKPGLRNRKIAAEVHGV